LVAAAQQRPERLVGGRERRAGENQRHEQKARAHHETRRAVECSIGGAIAMIDRRQLLHGTLATAVLATAGPATAQVDDTARGAMTKAAAAFLAALGSGQARAAVFP